MSLGLFTGRPGVGEILVVVLLLVLFFGAKRLPELARSLGKSINEFKKGKAEDAEETPGASTANDEADADKT